MRQFLSILVSVTISLWLGGLVMIFITVPTLFQTFAAARPVAGNAAAGIFHAFERYQLVLAAVGLIATFAWRVVVREPNAASGIIGSKQSEPGPAEAVPAPTANLSKLVQRILNGNDLPTFANDLLTAQAVAVGGSEAAWFLVEPSPEKDAALRLVCHIRPDDSTSAMRDAAVSAFQDLIRPCLVQNRDGAIEIASPTAVDRKTQFCLITLHRAKDVVVAVSAVITRCIDTEQARKLLMNMQLMGGCFELYVLRKNPDATRLEHVPSGSQTAMLKTACFALLALATVAAASSTLFITPRIDAMRLHGETYGPTFGRIHGISMSLYFFEALLLLIAVLLLPSIIARDGGRS